MTTPVIMPRMGQSVESCIITKWHKQKGDFVKPGDLLFSYETDKAAFDEAAQVAGTLLEIFYDKGEDVPTLTNVGAIGNPGESAAEFSPKAAGPAVRPEAVRTAEDKETAPWMAAPSPASGNRSEGLKISPRARNFAKKLGVDPRDVPNSSGPGGRVIERDIMALRDSGPKFTPAAAAAARGRDLKAGARGTGLDGRITVSDLEKSAAAPETAASVALPFGADQSCQEVQLSNIRKVIAKTMRQSLAATAQLTLQTSFDATEILEYRRKVKEYQAEGAGENITINDLIAFAVSRTLPAHRELNAWLDCDERFFLFEHVHLGIATDTERGLMVPTLFNADQKSLDEISREIKALVRECREGTVNPDRLRGGTFTITNLGMLGIESFTPILNPSQTGILGINNLSYRVKKVGGEYQHYPALGLSLTFDHRALDGASAARFLQELTRNLENFLILLSR
jgi:pyruvate dehydrogenase E2 component (dihydrolipoamide acetyltransferase)